MMAGASPSRSSAAAMRIGLSGQRVVGPSGAGGRSDAERLDDHGAIACGRQQPEQMAVAERRAEETGQEHDRLSRARAGDAQGLGGSNRHEHFLRLVKPDRLLRAGQRVTEHQQCEQSAKHEASWWGGRDAVRLADPPAGPYVANVSPGRCPSVACP
jgi:hypothetical protein